MNKFACDDLTCYNGW